MTSHPVPVLIVDGIDGTPNKAGQITEVVDLILWYCHHTEWMLFAVTGLGWGM